MDELSSAAIPQEELLFERVLKNGSEPAERVIEQIADGIQNLGLSPVEFHWLQKAVAGALESERPADRFPLGAPLPLCIRIFSVANRGADSANPHGALLENRGMFLIQKTVEEPGNRPLQTIELHVYRDPIKKISRKARSKKNRR